MSGLLALVPLVLFVAVLLVPAERVGAFAAEKASAALGRAVQVERIGIGLLPPAIALEGVTVAGSTAVDSALVSAARVELRPRLLPLLRRRVVVDEIALERPVFRIEVFVDSTTNLPTLGSDGGSASSGDAELSIRRLRVTDGVVVFRDATNGTVASIGGIDQTLKLSGSIAAGELAAAMAEGELTIADLDVEAPAHIAWPLRDVQLRIAHDISVDRTADRIELERLSFTVQQVALDVTGHVAAFSDSLARTIELHARTGSIDIARLIESLPQSLRGVGEVLTGAGGSAQLDVMVSGHAGAGVLPQVAGTLVLEDGVLARGGSPLVEALGGRIAFSLDSISSDGITGRLLGEPFTIALTVHHPAAPEGSVRVQGALPLAAAQDHGLIPDTIAVEGRVAVDITAAGPFTDPAAVALTGAVELSGVQLGLPALRQPVAVQRGRVLLAGQTASAQELRATIGESDVAVDFTAQDWLPYALGDTLRPPTIAFDARAGVFDIDEILGATPQTYTYGQLFVARLADRKLDGRDAAQIAEEIGLGMPALPRITLDGRIRAQRFVRGSLPLHDVDITVGAVDGQLDVRAASFRMMGGGVHLAGRLGLAANDAAQPLALDYTISDVAAAEFLQRFTGFREHMTGDLLIAGTMNMLLDDHLLPVRESVAGAGTLAVLEGEIINWPLLRRLGEKIGVAEFDTLAFRDWSGRYRIDGPQVVLEESMLESGDIGVRAAGMFNVNGALDLGATVYMPQEWAARVPGAPAAFVASAAAGEDGRVPVGARFAGTAQDPSVAVDLSEVGARVANAARAAAQREAQEAAARAAGQLTGQVLPRDSLSAAADSAKKKVEAEVVNRLRRIIRH